MRQASERGPAVGPQVIFGIDATGMCTLSIGDGLKDLGLQPGELVGQNLFAVYRDNPSAQDSLRRALAGETFTVERVFGGRLLWVYYQPVRDSDGSVSGALGVSTDVTEQRRIESEARASRERASLLADLSAALTREVLDPEALLRVAVRSVTEPVAEVGVVWLRMPDGARLEPRALWYDDDVPAPSPDWTVGAGGQPVQMDMAEAEALSAPQTLDLGAAGDTSVAPGELTARLAKSLGMQTGLRVPLRSRGLLIGVIDVARGDHLEAFTEDDVALVMDIAERCALALDNALLLKAQREAREELVKFQALADASDNLIAITDNQDHMVYVNPRVHEYGIDLSGGHVWTTIAIHAGESTVAAMRGALETAGRWSGDLTVSISGEEAIGHVAVFRLSHPDTGAALGTAWIGQDVTEIRATEAALRAANADLKQFKALVEASPDFIAIAALDGTVKYVNPPGRDLIGMDPDTDVSTTRIADYLTPEGLDASVEVEQPAVIANGHWEGESTLRNHRGGEAIPVAIASFLIHDPETGQPFALATVQRDITERLTAETALRELADQRQALLTRLVDAQDAERTQIAADVHDDPVQALAAVDLRLGQLRRQLRDHAPDLLDALVPVQTSVTGATDRLRALLFDLEPPDLERGLTGALSRAADEIFDNTAIRWAVHGEQEPDVLDASRAVAYRIAKEAMVNARKHASARNVVVTIAGSENGLEVSIADDGVGLGPEPVQSTPGHRGLYSMQDRAEVAGGRCSIRSRHQGGTIVTAWLPGPSRPE